MTRTSNDDMDAMLARLNQYAGGILPTSPAKEVGNSPTTNEVGRENTSQPTEVGRKTKYPWSEWMDARIHTAKEGDDFQVSRPTFQTMLHNMARKYKVYVATTDLGEGEIQFQFCATKIDADNARRSWRRVTFDDGYGDIPPDER